MASNEVKIIHDKEGNAKIIQSGINLTLQNILKKEALNYYAQATNKEKRNKLQQYKNKFANYMNLLENNTNVNLYFQAYEFILNFRQFILGKLGDIDYTFAIRVSERGANGSIFMKTLTIGSIDFINLMKDKNGNVIGLSQSGNNLRFNSAFLNNLKTLIKNIEAQGMSIEVNAGCSSFSLVNETLGTRQDFSNGKLFKSYIQALQRQEREGKWYTFIFKGGKDESSLVEKQVFKFEIDHVEGNPISSSIFSAIGKYFSDEMNTKRQIANTLQLKVDSSYPNAGNLTELYILAKQRLNNGKNTFRPKPVSVSGQTLFQLYTEIKKNTQPFYSGGDVLMEQIKSFLGSNPSLTSYATIRKTIENFYNALNTSNIETMKKELSNLLLQKGSDLMSQEQKDLSLAISNSFESFFNNMI